MKRTKIYKNDKEILQKQARNKYRELPNEEKDKKRNNTEELDTNLCLKKKRRLERTVSIKIHFINASI